MASLNALARVWLIPVIVAVFSLVDVLLTAIGSSRVGFAETNPLPAFVFASFGAYAILALMGAKIVAFGVYVGLRRVLMRPDAQHPRLGTMVTYAADGLWLLGSAGAALSGVVALKGASA